MSFARRTPHTATEHLVALNLCRPLPTLTTGRLILRAPRTSDFDAFAQIACSVRGKSLGGPMDKEQAWHAFAQMTSTQIPHGTGLWTIGHAGRVGGFVVLGCTPGDSDPVLCVHLAEDAEGQGIAREAAQTALSYAVSKLGWTTLISHSAEQNTRSANLASALGGMPDTDGSHIWRSAPQRRVA